MAAAVEVLGVSKSYSLGELDIEVLSDIDLTIAQGSFVSIMGPSGSGKSTLLYLLGGLDTPSRGTIRLMDRELSSMNDEERSVMRRREIGFIFQFYNLVPNLNVEENVMLPVLLDGQKPKEFRERLAEILDLVGLTDRKYHTPRELSGGQQQRVAIARALINRPSIILADEPIGNLDTKTGTGIMKLLKQINQEENKTIIQVTHSQEAAGYGSKIINVRDGKVCGI